MLEFLSKPWPWYVAGPLIGLFVPLLLLLGNKQFGISSTFRHLCSAVLPSRIKYFQYDLSEHSWSIAFAFGIVSAGIICFLFLQNPEPIALQPATIQDLKALGINDFTGYAPSQIFGGYDLISLPSLIFLVMGGFLVGFGTRYANGCTSGHSIMGLSLLSKTSLIATICFMIGGFLSTHLILPLLLKSL